MMLATESYAEGESIMATEERKLPTLRRSRYQPLADDLAARREQRITLTFADIEAILGAPLPLTATVAAAWWVWPGYPHVRRWRVAGWQARLDRPNRCVRFFRDATGG